ncbi:MAG TPA: PKD domain-containing protein [Thermoanaerobaculia bacterium]|nr:PKD domain-containing protein [Thermoanaerobaculia bacterium]
MMAAAVAQATTIILPTDEQLVAKSPIIVEATVVNSAAVDRGNRIWTETTLAVTRALKGNVAGNIVVGEVGGILGNKITKIFGAPEYVAGEHVLAFLVKTPRGDYQTVDLYVGKFAEQETLAGERLWVRHDETADAALRNADFQPVRARNVQRRADGFERFIAARVAGKTAAQNYGVENPVTVAPRQHAADRFNIESNFTLISDPTVYRWFAFQNGQTVKWFSSGTQTGYTGGGVNEISTAMNAWNGYSSALIRYSYSGVESGTPKPIDQNNGVNEILFSDPFQEISGTFSGSGVVGVGGFNGISGSSSWTGPFDADGQHRAINYTAYNITEAGLTIQDGVSPSTGVPSTELAEIVSHEFGHTLGFGHSTDNTALMYPTVTGRGPSLRTDDQNAARWLYPNGSAPPPPPATVPAAPTGLTATPSGTNVALAWTDNATNETGETVYYAVGNGSFTKVTDLAANLRSATLTGFPPGTYRFYVTASNSAGESQPSNTASATISSSTLTASFSVSPSSGFANSTVFTFADQSTGTVTARSWSFGDGGTSTVSAPTHVYATPGQYTVTLTVSNSGASSQSSRVVSISQALAASFTFSPANPTAGQSVQFTDQSAGSVATWSWDFGDGTGSSAQNPVKVYGSAGAYIVRLTIGSGGSSSTTTRNVAVTAPAPVTPPVSAAFDFVPPSPQVGDMVIFFDRSTGSPATWFWNFGDGSSSSMQNPTHAYALPGTYTVTLAAYNAVSSSLSTHQLTVAQPAPFRSLVSAAAQTNGAGGSVWRTELTLFNAGNEPAYGQFIFLPSAGGSVQTRQLYLVGKQSLTYANALQELFGMSSGTGALAIEAQSATTTPNLKITSRTFTTGSSGTYGQAVPQVSDSALQQSLYLTGMESDTAFRTNIGLVNRSNDGVGAQLTLVDANGTALATSTVVVAPNNFSQAALSAFFPSVTGNYASLSMRITTGAPGAISAYASVLDNRTQDPVYIQAVPLASASKLVIPAVGRLPGANGTFWRSDVTLFNANEFTPQTVTLRYRAAGADNRNAPSHQYTVLAGRTMVLADVLSAFGLTSGSGALEVTWSAGSAPVVTSRTYTTVAGGGTFGQSIDPVAAFGRDAFVPGLRSDFNFRSNVGFVNDSDVTTGVTVSLLGANGQTLATAFVQLPPKSNAQSSVAALFPDVNVNFLGSFTLQAHDDSGQLFAYGSIVDNGSGDPVFFAGQ